MTATLKIPTIPIFKELFRHYNYTPSLPDVKKKGLI
jgi:hypothetical protein